MVKYKLKLNPPAAAGQDLLYLTLTCSPFSVKMSKLHQWFCHQGAELTKQTDVIPQVNMFVCSRKHPESRF